MLLPAMFQHEATGDHDAAVATAAKAAQIGERFDDADLFALAVHSQGQLLVTQGRVEAGLGLLDEAMVAVTAGELSPIVGGLVYCGVILGCQEAYEVRRAQEWTAALTRWCEAQPDMVASPVTCLVHRAEILQLHGAWPDALEEAQRAGKRCVEAENQAGAAEAVYRQADVHRLRGDFAAAEEAYREASRGGREPQPGLALLRLAQGDIDAAAAAIRRVVGRDHRAPEARGPAARICRDHAERRRRRGGARRLPRARGDRGGLRERHADCDGRPGPRSGRPGARRRPGRPGRAASRVAVWRELEAPYEGACARVLVGLACRALGDDDAAAMELDAARGVFSDLGAAPDLARIQPLSRSAARPAMPMD